MTRCDISRGIQRVDFHLSNALTSQTALEAQMSSRPASANARKISESDPSAPPPPCFRSHRHSLRSTKASHFDQQSAPRDFLRAWGYRYAGGGSEIHDCVRVVIV